MRVSGPCLAAVLLLSSTAFAQHTASSPPPAPPHVSPPPAPPHVAAPPAPAHVASPPSSPHASSPSAASHGSGLSAPRPASTAKSSDAHAVRVPEPERQGVVGEQKIVGEDRIVSAPRIGEDAPRDDAAKEGSQDDVAQEGPVKTGLIKSEQIKGEQIKGDPLKDDLVKGEPPKEINPGKEADGKRPEPELRRWICAGPNCKEPAPRPGPTESDLRHPICPGGKCACPPGVKSGDGGCVASTTTAPEACAAGAIWNGTACVPTARCRAGEIWNGASCHADCTLVNGQAQSSILELRSARQNRDDACRQDPSTMLCQQAGGHYHSALSEYQNLLGGAPTECRSALPDPFSL